MAFWSIGVIFFLVALLLLFPEWITDEGLRKEDTQLVMFFFCLRENILNHQTKHQDQAKQNVKSEMSTTFFCYYSFTILRFMIPSLCQLLFFCLSPCIAICHVPPLPQPVPHQSRQIINHRWEAEPEAFLLQPIMDTLHLTSSTWTVTSFLCLCCHHLLNCAVSYGTRLASYNVSPSALCLSLLLCPTAVQV